MTGLESQRLAGRAALADGQVEELLRRNAELAAAVEARDTFIAVAAHELRNPMTPIIGQIELLNGVQASRCPPDQAEQRLERIQRAMRHDVKRAGILLDVSRIASGKLQLEPRAFDLAALLREVAGGLADPARRAGSLITVTGPDTFQATWDCLPAPGIGGAQSTVTLPQHARGTPA